MSCTTIPRIHGFPFVFLLCGASTCLDNILCVYTLICNYNYMNSFSVTNKERRYEEGGKT